MKKHIVAISSLVFIFVITIIFIILTAYYLSLQYLWSILAIEVLAVFLAFIVLLSKKRRIETRTRWAIFIVFVPILGIISYIYFGRHYRYKITRDYKYQNFYGLHKTERIEGSVKSSILSIINKEIPHYLRAFLMGLNQQSDLIYQNSKVQLFNTGSSAWVQIMKDLAQAKSYILLNLYIIKDGELYKNVVSILKEKVKMGVKIYLIYDFFGCYGEFTKKMQLDLKKSGINIIPFAPVKLPFINWTMNYRDHRKDISIDGKIGYTGGMNLADEYININKRFGVWNDLMVKITGEAVQGIEKIFSSDWDFYSKTKLIEEIPKIGLSSNRLVNKNHELIQAVSSGPNHQTPMHFDLLLNLINSAQKRIWLATPYFVPPIELIKALDVASRSGIDVRILLPGKTDKKFVLDVSKYWTNELYKSGVKIYSLNNTFSHMKAYLFDDEISFVGSTNLDFRSFFSDQQTMLLIKSKTFTNDLLQKFQNDFSLSFLYKFNPSQEHGWIYKLVVKASNIIMPLL